MSELKIEYLPISEIKLYEHNAKLHPEYQIEQIAKSIQEFGFNDPIAISNGIIVEGHGRLLAAQQLNFETVPIIRLDELTDEQRRAYTLIHNQLTMNSGFDFEILSRELENIADIDMSDFDFNLNFDESQAEQDEFSINDIAETNGYDKNQDEREYFEKVFTFPIAKKNQIICYLKKHQNEIVEQIIKDSETEND